MKKEEIKIIQKRILYCDDDMDALDFISTYLIGYGFHVDTLTDSSQVVPALDRNGYDLLITSAWTEPQSGFRVCKAVRSSVKESLKNLPIMLVSPVDLDDEQYRKLIEMDVYFMTKFRGPDKWNGKIKAILKK